MCTSKSMLTYRVTKSRSEAHKPLEEVFFNEYWSDYDRVSHR